MHVAQPQARDGVSRPPVIPPGVAQARAARDAGYKPPTEKDLQVSTCLVHMLPVQDLMLWIGFEAVTFNSACRA